MAPQTINGDDGASPALRTGDEWSQPACAARLPECTDLTSTRREYVVPLPGPVARAVEAVISDPRDMVMIHLIFNITITTMPAAALLFAYPSHGAGLALVVANMFMWLQRFILCMHYSEHRPIWKGKWALLNHYLPEVVAPFFGIPPGMYHLHHCVMHHLENNVFPTDISSTMPYQRDKPLHFLHYWLKFNVYSLVYLPYYAAVRKRYRLMAQSLLCTAGWVGGCAALCHYGHGVFALWAFIVPFFISGLAMMFGNWSQHIFVDPANPFANMRLSYNCMNHVENLYTFNDGYHIVHHINSRVHWADMPSYFIDRADKFAKEDAITFDNLHFMQVGVFVFTGNYEALYRHFVDLSPGPKRSREEITALLKSRLVPCGDHVFSWGPGALLADARRCFIGLLSGKGGDGKSRAAQKRRLAALGAKATKGR